MMMNFEIYKSQKKTKILLLFALIYSISSYGQIIVNSLEELLPYLDDDNVDVKVAPGTYDITAEDIENGKFDNPFFLIEGNNSTFDFEGVKINVDTEIFLDILEPETIEFALVGSNCILKNVTVEDIGNQRPYIGALNFLVAGEDNTLEGVHATVRGSKPYGYGDMFGKGADYTIKHHKHSAIRITGYRNTVRGCTVIHRAYGHCIFNQGGIDILVEDCYLEGEMRSTDEVLQEEGTGTYADEIDFMTVWGYRVPPGWMFSCQEDGIRAYYRGRHWDGTEYETENFTVRNCTVKNFRNAYTLGSADGIKYVENSTAIGCEEGFWLGRGGTAVNCSADAQYGPVYNDQYSWDDNCTADIKILPSGVAYGNHNLLAYLAGSNNNITLTNISEEIDPNLKIMVGGTKVGLRLYDGQGQNGLEADDMTLTNNSPYQIFLANNCSDAYIETCGTVTDDGSGNSINYLEGCSDEPVTCESHDAFTTIQAESYCDQSGIKLAGGNVGFIENGDWISFSDVDFGSGAVSFEAQVSSGSSGGNIELHLDSESGTLIGTCIVGNTGGWVTWDQVSCNVIEVSGIQDLYLVFTGGSGYLLDIDWFKFSNQTLSINDFSFYVNELIYPNPVSSTTTIDNAANSNLNVYDMNGSIVFTKVISSESEVIDLSKLSSGIYYGEVVGESSIAIIKIVKN